MSGPLVGGAYVPACDSSPYGKDPKGYLQKKEHIAYVVKIAGPPSFAEFHEYFHGSIEDEKVGDYWARLITNMDEKFLVIKSIKGSGPEPGDVISASNNYGEYKGTSLGRSYILFLDKADGGYRYDKCDFANTGRLRKNEVEKILQLPPAALVSDLVDNYLMDCLEKSIE